LLVLLLTWKKKVLLKTLLPLTLVEFTKFVLKIPRPIGCETFGYSFPSTHAFLFGEVSFYYLPLSWLLFIASFLRVLANCHTFLDVTFGYFLGLLVQSLLNRDISKYLKSLKLVRKLVHISLVSGFFLAKYLNLERFFFFLVVGAIVVLILHDARIVRLRIIDLLSYEREVLHLKELSLFLLLAIGSLLKLNVLQYSILLSLLFLDPVSHILGKIDKTPFRFGKKSIPSIFVSGISLYPVLLKANYLNLFLVTFYIYTTVEALSELVKVSDNVLYLTIFVLSLFL
jgi:hypothetical protein